MRKRLTTDLSSSVKSFSVSDALVVSGVLDVKSLSAAADPFSILFANSVGLFFEPVRGLPFLSTKKPVDTFVSESSSKNAANLLVGILCCFMI